jgi:putative transposase
MPERGMYRWRRMTERQRAAVLEHRRTHGVPWHSPPHYAGESGLYLMTAACYEHRHVIGRSPERMAAFEQSLLDTSRALCSDVFAWTVLPNHYHMLVKSQDVKTLLAGLGRLHGRTSFQWNGEEHRRGRKVCHNAAETAMKSERHYWASFVYVLHNAVKHGYVTKWQDWPFCNARMFLDHVGRDEARRLWDEYPIDEYGADWDPPDL